VLSLLIVTAVLAIIEAAAQWGYVGQLFLSPPTAVFHQLIDMLGTAEVQADIVATLTRIGLGFGVILVLGAVLSVLLWQYETLREAYVPLLGGLFGTPIVLAYLVFVAIFGRGTAAIVAIAIPLGTIPIVLSATDALLGVEKHYIDVARIYRASRFETLTKVIVPAAAPGIFAGIRVGFTYTVIAVIGTEFLLVINRGIGGMISNQYFAFRTTEMFVGIVLIMLLVMVSIFGIRRVEEAVQR
jgi:ABC-type nitrate/sulfonate/bicarbonate transport system permease component